MSIRVVEYSPQWPQQFEAVAADLRRALRDVPISSIELVGSTSVPGLAAKPVLDIDVLVAREHLPAAVAAMERAGYSHRGDLGVAGREAFHPPDHDPVRHVYVCEEGTLHVRNHLAVRQVLRERPDLRDRYAETKWRLAADPDRDIDSYIAGKSAVLQDVLAHSDLTDRERAEILRLNSNG